MCLPEAEVEALRIVLLSAGDRSEVTDFGSAVVLVDFHELIVGESLYVIGRKPTESSPRS